MKKSFQGVAFGFLLFGSCMVGSAVDRYVSLGGGHVPPFTSWTSAATNIQAAIDAASAGDAIWVTNGVYVTGGKVMAGDLTNRVALDKALTVQSVNGPAGTVIQGAWDPATTNGLLAVRCAWLTNGATLRGFTLERGATRLSGDFVTLRSGGGSWCSSSNAVIANCVIRSNACSNFGGGAYQGTLYNCLLNGNKSTISGGGATSAFLMSCTIVSNSFGGVESGPVQARLTNCIVYFNNGGNYSGGTFSFCCTTPLPGGAGNISAAPQFISDGFHLASGSPCRAAGTNLITGTDIDGQPWANPPSIGCDEWQPAPLIFGQPKIQLTSDPVGFTIGVPVAGQEPFTCWWTRDGVLIKDDGHYSSTDTTNLVASGVNSFDGGNYQVVVSNAFGVATSAVVQLVVHYVDAAGVGPVPPYLSWASAATNIQDAIDAALPGALVFVTNGVYATGGKVMGGDLTNRVALNKAIIVQSVNGPTATTIRGAADSGTNGPLAVRCAWLTNGATLSGFTLCNGATRALGTPPTAQMSGGGVWGASPNATVVNCVIATNLAALTGGGAAQATLIESSLIGNRVLGTGVPGTSMAGSGEGGGASFCNLKNCMVTGNFANNNGGGTAYGNLRNCSLTKNFALSSGGGAYSGRLTNCTVTGNAIAGLQLGYGGGAANGFLANSIVYGNITGSQSYQSTSNHNLSTLSFCCTAPLSSGAGNISVDPLVLGDGVHLSQTSPCRGAGTNIALGVDIDGQSWANPPSIGCDEWWPAPVIGSQPIARLSGNPVMLTVGRVISAGQEPFAFTWFKNGNLLDDGPHFNGAHTTNLTVNGFGPADAGNYQIVASNAFGMATSAVVQLVVHCVDAASVSPAVPYLAWSTAATNIQDAIDAASPGEIVLVTNGVYAAGGKVMVGDLTNRVALDKALTVVSVNGPAATVIQGAWDTTTTNGPLAVRCAWLADGANLRGFRLQAGATRSTGDSLSDFGPLQCGGGVWCASSNAVVVNCVLSGNAASASGAGAFQGTLENCVVTNNTARYGGGTAYGTANNCLIVLNGALNRGGGAYSATLNNCTVVFNYVLNFSGGGGTSGGTFPITRNSIVLYNTVGRNGAQYSNFESPAQYSYCCTSPSQPGFPMPSGVGNINAFNSSPQMLDWFHIATTSPCRGAGSPLYASGTDLDGEPWANPPSIGCDEVVEANLVGPLSVAIVAPQTNVLVNHFASFGAQITGRIARVEWSFGDGSPVTFSSSHMWTNVGDYTLTLTAFNTDNPGGVSTNLLVHVLPPNQPLLQSAAMTTNGFQFGFPGQESVQYWIEMATNLTPPVVWQTLQTIFYSTGGVHQITDSARTNETRFYRVKAQ